MTFRFYVSCLVAAWVLGWNPAFAQTLLDASQAGHTTRMRELLASGADVNMTTREGITPLHVAALNNKLSAVEFLLTNGAKIDAQDTQYGATPLHLVAHLGHKEVAELLLKHGASLGLKDKNGRTPLDSAKGNGQRHLIDILTGQTPSSQGQQDQEHASLDLSPKDFYDRGVALGREGHFAEARTFLQKALAASPRNLSIATVLSFAEDSADARFPSEVGQVLFSSTASGNQGDWSAALSAAQKAAAAAPQYAPAQMHLGVVYAKFVFLGRGNHYGHDAITAYRKAVALKADYALAHFNLGVAYAASKQWKLSKAEFQHAKALAQAQGTGVLSEECDRMIGEIARLK